MITVRLFGGLGNQMFQYALGRRLALENKSPLTLDISHYDQYIDRGYALNCFSIPDDVEINGAPDSFYDFTLAKNPLQSIKQYLKMLTGSPKRITQEGFSYGLVGLIGSAGKQVGKFEPSILSKEKDAYIIGFWQNEKYFLDYADQISMDFTVKNKPSGANARMLKLIESQQSVSLHVRRGDYVTTPEAKLTLGSPPVTYYKKAAEAIKKEVEQPIFYVFSDDPSWCKKNLRLGGQVVFVDHNPPDKGYEDMRLMSACKHNVITNSSFSWWGAWLNRNPDKIIIAPRVWFRDKSIDTSDVVPKSWIRL